MGVTVIFFYWDSTMRSTLAFCSNCGSQILEGSKFCSSCGSAVTSTVNLTPSSTTQTTDEKEKVFFRGEGELIIKTTKHHGVGRKAASWLLAGPVGYALVGRDSKRTTKAKGMLIVTEKAIYCAGNKYPFDRILATTIVGTFQKKIHVTLDKDIGAGGRGKGIGNSERISVEIEITTEDINGLFKGLEAARMSNVQL